MTPPFNCSLKLSDAGNGVIHSVEKAHISEITHGTYPANCVDKQGKKLATKRERKHLCCSLNHMENNLQNEHFNRQSTMFLLVKKMLQNVRNNSLHPNSQTNCFWMQHNWVFIVRALRKPSNITWAFMTLKTNNLCRIIMFEETHTH